MTETASALTCSGWAREWRPQTKDGVCALALYDDATISGIADTLPGFAEGADQDVLAGLIRQWASQHLAIRRRVPREAAVSARDKLKDVAAHLRAATQMLNEISDVALAAEPLADSGGLRDLARNLDSALSLRRVVGECAVRAERTVKALEQKVGPGRPRADEKRAAIKELCSIYHIVTGRLPARHFNAYAEQGNGAGPFEAFVMVAIKPLWPTAGKAGRTVREAAQWYKKQHSNA